MEKYKIIYHLNLMISFTDINNAISFFSDRVLRDADRKNTVKRDYRVVTKITISPRCRHPRFINESERMQPDNRITFNKFLTHDAPVFVLGSVILKPSLSNMGYE